MALLKSEIIGKSLLDLYDFIKGISGSNIPHCEWKSLPTKHLDFITKCTLRCANSYGAKYKIDSNHELTVKHTTNGQAYTLESYKKLLTMIVTGYDDDTQSSQEQPIPTSQDIKVGTHWERINYYSFNSPDGEVITVERVDGDTVYFNKSRNRGIKNFLDSFKPRPDLDTPVDSTNASCEFSIGDLICYNQEARDTLLTAKGTLPNEVIGTVTKVLDRTRLGSTPLLEYKNIQGTELNIDSAWVTKYIATSDKAHTTEPKSKPVAQPEPIQSITKEKPMAQKPTIKDTAVTLVAANKDAAILAAKLEAGKILNKQVIKLIKPKLHPLVRGYADSPLASVVLANIVGFAIKQYAGDNAKAGQLAEMMLQASAVESISALNIDGLIDDLLSSVKLPKSVRAELNGLDEDYE